MYVGNLTAKKAAGKLRFPGVKSWFNAKTPFAILRRDPAPASADAHAKRKKGARPTKASRTMTSRPAGRLTAAQLAKTGLPYELPPLSACLFVLTVR